MRGKRARSIWKATQLGHERKGSGKAREEEEMGECTGKLRQHKGTKKPKWLHLYIKERLVRVGGEQAQPLGGRGLG